MLRALLITLLATSGPLFGLQEFEPGVSPKMPETGFAEGNFIPDVELPLINGAGTLRLSDFRSKLAMGDEPEVKGKKLLLIHFASW